MGFRKTRSKRQRGSGACYSSECRADVNAKDDNGSTALHMASEAGNVNEVVRLLEQPRIDVNVQNTNRRTALMLASRCGRTKVAEMLLNQSGINVNVKDNNDQTALMHASMSGRTEIVINLLEKGADIMLTDKDGKTALMMVEDEGTHFPNVEAAIVEHKKNIALILRATHEALIGVALRLNKTNTSAARVLGQTVTVRDKDGKPLYIHPFARKINEYLGKYNKSVGGKRKTIKSNKKSRKYRKSKKKSKKIFRKTRSKRPRGGSK